MDSETIAMTLIAHSGDARTLAFQALARNGERKMTLQKQNA